MTEDLERIWTQLTRIADGIEALVALQQQLLQLELEAQTTPEPPPPAETPGCPHPPEQKVSFGTLPSGEEEWECRQCRTHFPPPTP